MTIVGSWALDLNITISTYPPSSPSLEQSFSSLSLRLLLLCPVSSVELDEEPSAGVVAILERELVFLG